MLSNLARIGLAAPALALPMVLATGFEAPADANPLVTDGDFLAYNSTLTTTANYYICSNGAGNTCTSNLTDWSGTCASGHNCGNGATPQTLILYTNTTGSTWNGGIGLNAYTGPVAAGIGNDNVVALDGDSTYRSSIYQTISGLTIGTVYAVSFYQAAAEQSGNSQATTEQWQVSLGSTSKTSTLMSNSTAKFVAWNSQTLYFEATAANEVLTFLALGGPAGDPPVDLLTDVSMVAAPEPASTALVVAGVAAAVAVRRRRQKTSSPS